MLHKLNSSINKTFLHTSMQYSFWLLIRWFKISVLIKDTIFNSKRMAIVSSNTGNKLCKFDHSIWILMSTIAPKLSEFATKTYSLPWYRIGKQISKTTVTKQQDKCSVRAISVLLWFHSLVNKRFWKLHSYFSLYFLGRKEKQPQYIQLPSETSLPLFRPQHALSLYIESIEGPQTVKYDLWITHDNSTL